MPDPETPSNPKEMMEASQALGSASFVAFTEYAAQLTPDSVYRSSLDLGIWPGNLQTVPYMEALMSSYEALTDEQVSQGIRARRARSALLEKVPQEYVLSPSVLDGPLDADGQPRISSVTLHHQLMVIAQRLEAEGPTTIQLADETAFREARLAGLGMIFMQLDPAVRPFTVMQGAYRMAVVNEVSVPELFDSWHDLKRAALPADETLKRIRQRIQQLAADNGTGRPTL